MGKSTINGPLKKINSKLLNNQRVTPKLPGGNSSFASMATMEASIVVQLRQLREREKFVQNSGFMMLDECLMVKK